MKYIKISKYKSTKKITLFLFFILFCLSLINIFGIYGAAKNAKNNELSIYGIEKIAYADDINEDEIEKEMEKEINKTINDIDLTELEKFIDEYNIDSDIFGVSLKEYLKKVINGEITFSLQNFFEGIMSLFFRELMSLSPILISIVILCVMCGLTDGLTSDFLNKSTNKIIHLVCLSSIIVMLSFTLISLIQNVINLVNMIKTFTAVIFPLLFTLMTALGGVVTVSVFQPLLAVFTTTILFVISAVIIPSFIIVMVFNIIGKLSDNINLTKFTKLISSLANWIMGVMFGLFTAFITAQGITGMSIDSISVKAARFAISSYVPILGGYLSDGFDLVSASCVLIKNALGLTSIICILGIIILPVLKLAVFNLGLKLIAAVVEPVTDKKISDMLHNIAGSVKLLISAVLGVAFIMFVMFMLIIYSFNI